MDATHHGSAVVGMRASGGPLLQTALPLAPGLNVLYGLNGVGKTRLLHALYYALTGERDNVFGAFDVDVELFAWLPGVTAATWGRDDRPHDSWLYPQMPLGWTVPDALRTKLLEQVNATAVFGSEHDGTDVSPGPFHLYLDNADDIFSGNCLKGSAALVSLSPRAGLHGNWECRRAVITEPGSAAEAVRSDENDLLEAIVQGVADDSSHDNVVNLAPRRRSALTRLSEFTGLLPPGSEDVRGSVLLDRPGRRGTGGRPRCALPDDGLPVSVSDLRFTLFEEPPENTDAPGRLFKAISEQLPSMNHLLFGLWRAANAVSWLQSEMPEEVRAAQEAAGSSWLVDTCVLANNLYARLLQDAPPLEFRLSNGYYDSFTGDKLQVLTDGRPLTSLSHAQRRWANLAIALACHLEPRDGDESGPLAPPGPVIIIDEPEAALHRSAERQMAAALAGIAEEFRCIIVVATHCPDLLDAAHAHVNHVRTAPDIRTYGEPVDGSDAGWLTQSATRVTSMTSDDRTDLHALGVAPSDMLPLMKWVLLVEGHHERVIFNELFADVLAAQRAIVIAMDGGKKLANTVDSHFLWRFTDARIIPILDKIDPTDLDAIYTEAQHTYSAEGPGAAHDVLARHLSGSGSGDVEPGWMREFLFGTLSRSVHQRVVPWGLSAADILCTLPVTDFVSSRKIRTWQDLFDRFERAKAEPEWQRRQRKPDWKTWATQTFGADFTDAAIVRSCRNLPAIPYELQGLRQVLETVD